MTTELTKAAQQALEQLEFLNACYPHKTAADAISALQSALTQRPAAQTERDTGPRVLREVFALCEDTMDKMAAVSTEFSRGRAFEAKGISRAIGTWFQDEYCGRSHMCEPSLPAHQQATPATPEDMKVYDGIAAGYFADAQQATPEPLTSDQQSALKQALFKPARIVETATPEPHLFIGACITDGRLHATVQRLESNGNVTLVATAEMDAASLHGHDCMAQMTPATPEPVGEPVAYREKLTGRLCEPEDTHRRKFPMCYEPLFTRPAPGVPEGFALVPVVPTKAMTTAVEHAMWERPSVTGSDVWSAVLAAAQAKGYQP